MLTKQKIDSLGYITMTGYFLRFLWKNLIDEEKVECWEIGYNLGKKYWGKGYTTEVMETVIDFTKRELRISQKNTIMWDKEESIPLMLKNRIVATID